MARKADLARAVAVTAELVGTELSDAALRAMVERLAGHPGSAVAKALERCQTELSGRLTLAAILDRLEDGHPGPEEAWALVARLGEGDTVVWTDEICGAWAVARPLMGDRVAARLAFLEAYRRRLADTRASARPAHWWPSMGWDLAGRESAIQEAIDRGRLPAGFARECLPPHEEDLAEATADGRQRARALVDDLVRQLARASRGGNGHGVNA